MKNGVMLPGSTDVKSAITSFQIIFLSVGSVEFWLAKGAGGTDYDTLHLQAGSTQEAI